MARYKSKIMRLYPITIDINKLTDEMIDWAQSQEANIYFDSTKKITTIQFQNSKISVQQRNGCMRLHLDFSQKNSALLFLLLFRDHIVNHNMKELEGVRELYDTA
jgi:hypothetical protein